MSKASAPLLALLAPLTLLALPALATALAGPAAGERAGVFPAAIALADYLRIDTANPPGDERAGAEYLAGLLRASGVEPRLLVSPGGRVSLYARLPASAGAAGAAGGIGEGKGAGEGALVLLHHIDTVPAGAGWRRPALGGEIHDGALWGRGAIDAKGLGIAHLAAFLDLARSPLPRRRALVFLAVADEEAGGSEGTGWLLTAHPELFEGVAAVLNEGGVNRAVAGRTLYWGIEVDQKRPLWLEVEATGRPGHASNASPESATHRLIAGLARLVAAPRPWRVTPATVSFVSALARFDPQARAVLETIRAGPQSNGRIPRALAGWESLLTDTLQVTTLSGSDRINVVAGAARAGIDVRLLPDSDEKAFLAELDRLLGPGLDLRVRLDSPRAPASSTTGQVYTLLAATLAGERATPVVPAFIPAVTDSRYFRARGIAAYGFSPFALDGLELRTVHAPDERMPLAELEKGVATMTRVVRALVRAEATAP